MKDIYIGTAKILLLLVVAVAMCSCIGENSGPWGNRIEVGDRVPEFTVDAADGSSFSSSQFMGRRSLLVFYTVTCGDCRRALPIIQEVYSELEGAGEGGRVILVAREDSFGDVAEYWAEAGYDMLSYFDPDRSVFGLFADKGVPRLYIIDSESRVEWMAVESFEQSAGEIVEMLGGGE